MSKFRSWIFGSALYLLGSWSMPQLAAADRCTDDDICKELAKVGVRHYEKQEYPDALKSFSLAYKRRPVPELLISIGRALHRLKRFQEAVEKLEEFRRQCPGSPLDQQVLGFIKEAKQQAAAVSPLPEPVPPRPEESAIVVTTNALTPTTEAPSRKQPYLIAGGVLAGLGLAGLLAGLGCYEEKQQLANRLARTNDEFEKLEYLAQAPHLDRGSIGGYVAGAALLGSATIVFGYGGYQALSRRSAVRRTSTRSSFAAGSFIEADK